MEGKYTIEDLKDWSNMLLENWAAGVNSTKDVVQSLKDAMEEYQNLNTFTPMIRK